MSRGAFSYLWALKGHPLGTHGPSSAFVAETLAKKRRDQVVGQLPCHHLPSSLDCFSPVGIWPQGPSDLGCLLPADCKVKLFSSDRQWGAEARVAWISPRGS